MTGVPEVSLNDKDNAYTLPQFVEECEAAMSARDKKLLSYFFLKYDCLNIVALLENPDAVLMPYGNFSADDCRALIAKVAEDKDVDIDLRRFPKFLVEFVRNYSKASECEGYFAKDAVMLEYYNHAMACSDSMIAEWYKMNFDVTNILTALIARQNGWKVGDYIVGDNEVCQLLRTANAKDFGLSIDYDYVPELIRIAECDDPVEKERLIDAFKWLWLDEQTFADLFSIDAVFAYMCKLEMLERWNRLDIDTGKETFRQIIENLRGEARVPDEFKR